MWSAGGTSRSYRGSGRIEHRAPCSSHRSWDRQRWRSDSYQSRRVERSRSRRRQHSPPRHHKPSTQVGYAYGEGRRAAAAAVPTGHVGYAYGEGRRAAAPNGGSRGHGSQQEAVAPRNALIQVGRRPTAQRGGLIAKQGKERRYVSGSCSADESVSSEASSFSGGSSASSESEDEETEEEKQAKPAAKPASGKDEIVHFDWQQGMVLNMKYVLHKALGDGTFGRVLQAYDQRDDRKVAIKIIRDVKRYMENAKIEAEILKNLRKADPDDKSRCAIMYETFTHERKFYCLVFEPLGVSLYDFMKKNAFRGFLMQDVQSFAKQCMKAMFFLHTELHLAHTDLKPENILLQSMEPPHYATFPRDAEWQARKQSSKEPPQYVRPENTLIKIIDFGNATYESEHHSSIINTRQYRGPEVVLEMEWNELSDIWSLGCIFMELYTGELLFGTHENFEHLALMEKIVEPIPKRVLEKTLSKVKEEYLRQDPRSGSWRLDWPAKASSPTSEQHVRNARTLEKIVQEPRHKSFLGCAYSMLTTDPTKRPSASQVQKDPFFQIKFDD